MLTEPTDTTRTTPEMPTAMKMETTAMAAIRSRAGDTSTRETRWK
ncbi:hypothetical protein [Lutispora saccharofermentans]|nr:hypothetical protein [Lutispora saccharofermentans]